MLTGVEFSDASKAGAVPVINKQPMPRARKFLRIRFSLNNIFRFILSQMVQMAGLYVNGKIRFICFLHKRCGKLPL
jgi:hypothetical protein